MHLQYKCIQRHMQERQQPFQQWDNIFQENNSDTDLLR